MSLDAEQERRKSISWAGSTWTQRKAAQPCLELTNPNATHGALRPPCSLSGLAARAVARPSRHQDCHARERSENESVDGLRSVLPREQSRHRWSP